MSRFLFFGFLLASCCAQGDPLLKNWRVQSSDTISSPGSVVSQSGFQEKDWYPSRCPATVLATLVQNGVYKAPYLGMNLRSIPGTSYKLGANFSNQPMPQDSPFRIPWWYRTTFDLPKLRPGQHAWIHFDGLNYRAEVWFNGTLLADGTSAVGTFRDFDFDLTPYAVEGKKNVIALKISPPEKDDLALTWVDWNPAPPDKNMGLWKNVHLSVTGPVTLRAPHVVSSLKIPSLEVARLLLTAEVTNHGTKTIHGTLTARIEDRVFSKSVVLQPGELKEIELSPKEFSELNILHPRVWWPYELGKPELYELNISFDIDGLISDSKRILFGIRNVSSELTPEGHRLFKINGRNILIRGGGWAPDMLLEHSPKRLAQELDYVQDLHLNTIRSEGKFETEDFYEQADRRGILLMMGWCCCDHWENWSTWTKEDYAIAAESLKSQIRILRNHPSVLVWLNGSDHHPPPDVEEMYLKILEEARWQNPILSSATGAPSSVTHETGVKMTGPYQYVAPNFWFLDHEHGGGFGFNTETSPGPSIPPIESLRQMIPPDHLWPVDEYWSFHAGGSTFKDLHLFISALEHRYGTSKNAEELALRSQVQAYETHRAMFEAYGRNKYVSTGVIQWMINNAWPSMIWHLYDYYLRPGGSYFGAKKANEAVHVMFSPDDDSVFVLNHTQNFGHDMTLTAEVLNFEMERKFHKTSVLESPPDSSTRVFSIPHFRFQRGVYFLRLSLVDRQKHPLSSNFYWLSKLPDIPGTVDSSGWLYTASLRHANFTQLNRLPRVNLRVSVKAPSKSLRTISLMNPSKHLAFFVHLKLIDSEGEEVLPVLWEDNYISLLPGETRVLRARIDEELDARISAIEADGWNINRQITR